VLVSSEYERMDTAGRPLPSDGRRTGPEWWLLWQLLYKNAFGGHSQVLYRRASALACGGYRPECRYAEDYQLWIDLTKDGGVACVPEVLMRYRVHDQSVSARHLQIQCAIAAAVADRAISALLGNPIAPEQSHALQNFFQSSFQLVDAPLSQLDRNVRSLRQAFWRRHRALATMSNRLGLAYRIRRKWASYMLYLWRAGQKRASIFAASRALLG